MIGRLLGLLVCWASIRRCHCREGDGDDRLAWGGLSPAARLELQKDMRIGQDTLDDAASFLLDRSTGYYWYDALGTQSLSDIWGGRYAADEVGEDGNLVGAECPSKSWTCHETCFSRWYGGTRVLWYCRCRYACVAKVSTDMPSGTYMRLYDYTTYLVCQYYEGS